MYNEYDLLNWVGMSLESMKQSYFQTNVIMN